MRESDSAVALGWVLLGVFLAGVLVAGWAVGNWMAFALGLGGLVWGPLRVWTH